MTARQEALIRASQARNEIRQFLQKNASSGTSYKPVEIRAGCPIGSQMPLPAFGALLRRMAAVRHENIQASGRYYQYNAAKVSTEEVDIVEVDDEVDEVHETQTQMVGKQEEQGVPIDLKVNDLTGSITIRYAGMCITLSKEQT